LISIAKQDYIKVIWALEQSTQQARTKIVADRLSVKPPSVLAMFRQLQSSGFVTYNKRDGAKLTNRGRREAEHLIRKHRLIETFLKKVLNIEEPLLHEEAEKLEHVISDQLIMKIDAFLNYPRTDPHGSVIPLAAAEDIRYKLSEIETNIEFKVVRIPMGGKEKNYCIMNKFIPGTIWHVDQIGPEAESFLVTNGHDFLAISDHLASKITVTIHRD
jgi:DtxR family Mn-dependent transcriptional regulator